jgi:phytoene dehydrogenase-like protein
MNVNTKAKVYDLVVVGGGISGLYAAYLFSKANPSGTVAVLEAAGRWGGRIETARFAGRTVPLGAGIGRADKDVLLLSLLEELDLAKDVVRFESPADTRFLKNPDFDVPRALDGVRAAVLNNTKASNTKGRTETFRSVALRVLGREDYRDLILALGFSDFERYDAVDAVNDYGFDDCYGTRRFFSVPWDRLVRGLVDRLRQRPGALLRLNSRVRGVHVNAAPGDVNAADASAQAVYTPSRIEWKHCVSAC